MRLLLLAAIACALADAAAAQVAPVSAVAKPIERSAPVTPLTEPPRAPAAAADEASRLDPGSRDPADAGLVRGKAARVAVRRAWWLGPGAAGLGWPAAGIGLFGPAGAAGLDRVAFAVDGAESSHGADPRMWRPTWSGPQGPMQVSAAAAIDVGGGDRFDLFQNRLLGRAYLAALFRRYGDWPDAIAAYNWGPGNLETWIAAGRPPARLPFGVGRYVERVMRDAALGLGGGLSSGGLARVLRDRAVPVFAVTLAGYRPSSGGIASGLFAPAVASGVLR